MNSETAVSSRQTREPSPRELFQCYCGERFQGREPLDEHLQRAHPEMLAKCNDCQRPLPKGGWKRLADENVIALVPPK
jgi:hypothetical protein